MSAKARCANAQGQSVWQRSSSAGTTRVLVGRAGSGDGPRRAHIHILIRPRARDGGRTARAELARLWFCSVPIPPSRAAVSHKPAPADNVFDMCGRQPYVATASQTGVPLSIMYTAGVRACRKLRCGPYVHQPRLSRRYGDVFWLAGALQRQSDACVTRAREMAHGTGWRTLGGRAEGGECAI